MFPPPSPPPPGDLPPNHGRGPVAPYLEFAAIVDAGNRTYAWNFDEALRNSWCNAMAMLRDPVIFGALEKRMMPVSQLSFHIDPDDDTIEDQKEAAVAVKDIIDRIHDRQGMFFCLQWAIWYGRAGVELAWEPVVRKGKAWQVPTRWYPINGDTLRFKWDDTVGIQVSGMFPGPAESTDRGLCHWLPPDERQCVIVHRHQREATDFWNGLQAGRYNGVGLRDRLYWIWFLKSNTLALMNNYLERFSNGLTIFYYDASNTEAKQEAIAAAQQQWSNTALIYPVWASNAQINKVERVEVGTATPALLQELVTNYYDSILEKTILGQELTHGTAPTGLGSGVAEAHTDTMAMIVKFDAINLQSSLQTDLVDVIYRHNYPGMRPGRIVMEVETPNAGEVLEQAESLAALGLPVDGDQLYEVTKLSKPQQGSAAVSKNQPMAPAAVGAVPAGVPATGPAGPPGMEPEVEQAPPDVQQAVQVQGAPQAVPGQAGPAQMSRTSPLKYQKSARYNQRIGKSFKNRAA